MTQKQVIEIVKNNNPQRYKKFGYVLYRLAEEGEKVDTVINGEVETTNTANKGDYILTGPAGEEYIVKPETIAKRYKVDTDTKLIPTGECFGNVYEGEPIEFEAAWGEKMICNPGDYLVSPSDEFTEAYRIEKDVFIKTYAPA